MMAKNIFNERIIKGEYSRVKEQIEVEFAQKEDAIIDETEFIESEDTEAFTPAIRRMMNYWYINEKIFTNKIQKIYVLANRMVELYRKHLKSNELTDEIVNYIMLKVQFIIDIEKSNLIKEFKDDRRRISKIEIKCKSIFNAIWRQLEIAKANQ